AATRRQMHSGGIKIPLGTLVLVRGGQRRNAADTWVKTLGNPRRDDASSLQETRDRNILVDIGPVYAVPASDQTPVPALLGCRVCEARKPGMRRGKLSAVGQHDHDLILCHRYIDGIQCRHEEITHPESARWQAPPAPG